MARRFWGVAWVALAVLISGCAGTGSGSSGSSKRGGGYYKDHGPDANPPSNLDQIPSAVPRIEPYASGSNRPYVVFGKRYVPDTSGQPYKMRGRASWYGKKFHGNSTSNGERYDMYAMTAAHTTLPLPSYVRVTSTINGRTLILRVNDRGPFHSDRIIDLSYVAAHQLGLVGPGSGEVIVEKITHDDIRRGVPPPEGGPAVAPPMIAATPAASRHAPAQDGFPDGSDPINTIAAATPIPAIALPGPPPVTARTDVASSSSAGVATPGVSTPGEWRNTSVSTAAAPVAGAVYLQLGAFSQPGNAQALAARVQQTLSDGSLQSTTDARDTLYRVKVGPYASRVEAIAGAERIHQAIGIMPVIAAP